MATTILRPAALINFAPALGFVFSNESRTGVYPFKLI